MPSKTAKTKTPSKSIKKKLLLKGKATSDKYWAVAVPLGEGAKGLHAFAKELTEQLNMLENANYHTSINGYGERGVVIIGTKQPGPGQVPEEIQKMLAMLNAAGAEAHAAVFVNIPKDVEDIVARTINDLNGKGALESMSTLESRVRATPYPVGMLEKLKEWLPKMSQQHKESHGGEGCDLTNLLDKFAELVEQRMKLNLS
jgi:hypothetical protein